MPLWSNEEWRARIGSCWCALGRPYKSSAVQRGRGASILRTQHLSGEMVLQAMSMMVTLTLVSLISWIGMIKTHVERVFQGTCGILLSGKFCSKVAVTRVLTMVILLLQVTAAVKILVLMRSGDVERNPGPGLHPDLDYHNVDDSVILTEEDFRDVYREVISLKAHYYTFGIELGLPAQELDAIRTAFYQNIDQAFTEVLLVWLRHRYKVEKYGPPTWRRLVEAVDSRAGGNNHALAKAVASKYPPGSSGIQEIKDRSSVTDGIPGCGDKADLNKPSTPFQKCHGTLATYYLRQVDERAWPPVKATNFINLTLVKDQTTWRKTVEKSVDEIVGDKETTSYQAMFNDIEESRFILLEGRPGTGKTTLMNKISRDWASGDILTSKVLVSVHLRRLNAESDRSLATILQVACPSLDVECLVSHIEQNHGEGIVFAFDGLDEYVPYSNETNTSSKADEKRRRFDGVFEVICGKILTKAVILVTSRPAACTTFRQYAGKRLEVLGFFKPQITEYINHYFDNDREKAQKLIGHLEQNPNLMNMAYLPLHCAMLTFLYEEDTVLPPTETEFYKHFTLSTLLRSIHKRQSEIIKLTSFEQLPKDDKVAFDKICRLAFNATVESKQVFTSSDVEKTLTGNTENMSSLGLVVLDRYFMKYGLDETYTFLHLTFQEYLAAIHISGLSNSQKAKIIKSHEKQRHLYVVWRFLCGMMDFQSRGTMNTFKSLMETTKDTLYKLQCCYETQNPQSCTHVISDIVCLSHYNFTPSDCAALGYVIKRSNRQRIHITFSECSFSFEGACTFLQQLENFPISLTFEGGKSEITILEGLKKYPALGLSCLIFKPAAFQSSRYLGDGLSKLVFCNKNPIGPLGAQFLGGYLIHCCHITELMIDGNFITDDGTVAISAGLMTLTNCLKLNLGHNNIGDKGAVLLSDAMPTMTRLQELNLCHNFIGDEGIIALSATLRTLTKLQVLYLGNNRICDEGAVAISTAMNSMPLLQYLDLAWNAIGDEGAVTLSKAMKALTNLQVLNLGVNSIGFEGAIALSKAMSVNLNIQKLYLNSNPTRQALAAPYVKHGKWIVIDQLVASERKRDD